MLNAATPLRRAVDGLNQKRLALRLAAFSAALCGFAYAHAGQLLVAAANSQGNATYELTRASSSTPLVNGILQINNDAAKHGSYDSLVWVPNAATGTLDLIAADATKQQIVRYSGPNYGTATILYTWGGQGHGPAQPDGLSVDAAGNLFVVSSSCGLDSAALWVMPVNAAGGYGAPVLIDRSFGGAVTLKLAETVVANSSTRLWNAGDLLVLVGDTLDARVMVYSHDAITQLLGKPSVPLHGPTSTPIPWYEFAANIAVPTGMDVLPADASHAASLLITTLDGRILRFDTGSASFIAPFAGGLGFGLQRIKVGSFADTPYAFVAQQGNGGQILEFGEPPASGANRPIASISKGVDSPDGLAVTASGSGSASSCVAPKTCDFLGGALTHQISGPGAANVGGQVLEQSCVVPSDPRVTVSGSNWSCNGLQTLDVANYCPGFPHTIVPGFMCGHAGPSGSGFAIIKATADGVDPVDNNSFVKTQSSLNAILPGPLNLLCTQSAGPLLAWAPRSDLVGIEGTIVEDALSPFFVEMTGFCDDGGANLRGLSMYALGLALNNTQNALPGGVTIYIDNKFANLQSTVTSANISGGVASSLEACITQSQTDFNSGAAGAANGYACAAYQVSQCDSYVRSNLGGFSSNLHPGGGNPNPAGEIDGRLANLFLLINTRAAGNAANPSWPATNVPACVTLTAPATATTGSMATLTWTAYGVTSNSTKPCALSSSDGHFNNTAEAANGSASTAALAAGTHNYTLTCPGSGGATGKATASINVSGTTPVVITSFTASPNMVANGNAALLSWTVTGLPNGSYCTLSATDGAFLAPNTQEGATGSGVSTGALFLTPTYTATLSCPGAAAAKTASVTVQPAPVPVVINSFTATPSGVPNGGAASLNWSVSNLPTSSSCTLSATDGTFATPNTLEGATGSNVSTGALTLQGTYTATLSCPNGSGTVTKTASVTVAAPAAPMISSFTASPTGVLYNSSSNLSWNTTGVPANLTCTLSATDGTYATATSVASSGTNVPTGPLTLPGTYTATLSCPGTGNTSAQKSVSFSVTVPNALNGPQGMAFGPNGDLYVANSGAGQVLVYAPPPGGGALVQQPSLTLTGFVDPVALAFDSQGNLYVVDAGNEGAGSILVYTPAELASAMPTPSAAATISVNNPNSVAVDNNGIVYVGNNSDGGVISAYQYQPLANQPALSNPQQLTYWFQDSVGYFDYVSALAFDGTHVLAAINGGEIEVYATGSSTTQGSLLSTKPGDTLTPVTSSITNGVNNPGAIAFDASANIYVAESGGNTVNQYSQSGVLGELTLGQIPGSGAPPSQYPALNYPEGVAVDGAGLIYVANTPNNTIDVYNAAGVYQYEFLPLVSVGQPSLSTDGLSLTWVWTSLGEPATATCSLTDTLGFISTTEPITGSQVTPYPSGSYFDNGTINCPGATGGSSYPPPE